MFGLISTLIKIIVSATPQALAERRSVRERELGAKLFRLHLIAFEIANRGDRIIEMLKSARLVMSSPDPDVREWWRWKLEYLLRGQKDAFAEFRYAVREVGVSLAALDPETFGQFTMRMDGKVFRVDRLSVIFQDDTFPLEAPREVPTGPHPATVNLPASSLYATLDASPHVDGEIKVRSGLNEATVNAIERYLSLLQPEQDIAEIHKLLKVLRETLDKNFNIRELLLDIQEYRGGRSALENWPPPSGL